MEIVQYEKEGKIDQEGDITCPKCRKGVLHTRVPRAWWVKNLLFFLPLKRYICYRCRRKSHIWSGWKTMK